MKYIFEDFGDNECFYIIIKYIYTCLKYVFIHLLNH